MSSVRRSLASALAVTSTALTLAATAGCGSGPIQPHYEVEPRKQIPIPVCTTPLAPLKSAQPNKAIVRSLDPDEWINVMIPSFNRDQGLGPTDSDCTGHYIFANETLRGGISQKGWPRRIEPEELDMRTGPGGMRTLWLRVLKFENGDEGGPIALVRAVNDRAEVYGIGSFRGPTKSKIEPMRLGNETIVVAESKVCPDQDDCRKRAQFYLNRRGRLIESASVDLERVAVVPSVTERGLYARYTLKTDVTYKPTGIQLLEQVQVKIIHYDEGQRDSDRNLRKVEFSRFLRVERDALFSSNDPLWDRVVGQD